ncbi:uncharacterized protein N7483_000101 [Penicillium malachiteum]|uniref:uncharacterized protein n=1 Tax=Penicillium malachiteum TaxID=1324776 RepID=UPI002547EC38|nr:uncharacterized protein N7483_000101 [Penicillium malachiteum]KAJ5734976.1 hypothetical protein N7483_000101 [Penicillium malachiteum]
MGFKPLPTRKTHVQSMRPTYLTQPQANQNKSISVIFVHGLTGNRETTWTHKTTGKFWPQDFLPHDLPDVRILTFGYDADIIGTSHTASSNTLRDHGKSLAEKLAMWRRKSRTNLWPLIFVAHGLGGLVVEQALLISRGSSELHVKDLLESTTAMAFMGTPHAGSDKASLVVPLTHLSKIILGASNTEILQLLRPGSEMLANLQQEFHTMLKDRSQNQKKSIEICCFYEELPVRRIRDKVVPSHSAILNPYPSLPIHGNQMQMKKFGNNRDPGYTDVRGRLWLWIDNLKLEAQPAAGPEAIQARDSKPERYLMFSGGGPVFQGDQIAGRDINVNTWRSAP